MGKFKFEIISEHNSKLAKDGIISINMPPCLTCLFAGICMLFCYAQVGHQAMGHAKAKRLRNLELWETDPKLFEEKLKNEIKHAGRLINRWMDSGDIVSVEFLRMMIRIAEHFQDRKFYCYTKAIPFILEVGWENIPSNLKIIQSYGGTKDELIDQSKPFAKVFKTEEEIPADFINASNSDYLSATSAHKIGIVAHGVRKSKFKTA